MLSVFLLFLLFDYTLNVLNNSIVSKYKRKKKYMYVLQRYIYDSYNEPERLYL